MKKEALDKLGDEVGAGPGKEDKKGPGRPQGASGRWESPKGKPVKWLQSEVWRHRREIKEKEDMIEKLQGQVPAQVLPQIPPEMIAYGVISIYDSLAQRYGDHWRLKEQEALSMGVAVGKVIERYMPEFGEEHKELMMLAWVAGSITMPRVLETMKLRKQKPKTPAIEKAATSAGVDLEGPKKKPEKKKDAKSK